MSKFNVKEGYAIDGEALRLKGEGSPEGVISAGPGSLYSDVDDGFVYFKSAGTGNVGWQKLECLTNVYTTGNVLGISDSVETTLDIILDTNSTDIAAAIWEIVVIDASSSGNRYTSTVKVLCDATNSGNTNLREYAVADVDDGSPIISVDYTSELDSSSNLILKITINTTGGGNANAYWYRSVVTSA